MARIGADVEHLGVARDEGPDSIVTFLTQPTPRFHGAVPAMLEEVQKLTDDFMEKLEAQAKSKEKEIMEV
jgi:hypothetical protein